MKKSTIVALSSLLIILLFAALGAQTSRHPYGPLDAANIWTGIQTFAAGIRGALLGNSTTVIDATGQSGSTMGDKLRAAMVLLSANGGTVDARGFTGAQTISSTVNVPAATTLLLGSVQAKCSVLPCITLNAGSRLLGQNGMLAWPNLINPTGTIIWETNNAADTALIACSNTAVPNCSNDEIGNLAVANVTALGSSLACTSPIAGIGIEWYQFSSSTLHDIFEQCFDTGIHASWSYYNKWDNIDVNSFQTAAIHFDTAFNENSITQVLMNFASGNASGILITGGGQSTVRDFDAENFTSGTQKIVNITSGCGWNIEGVIYMESLGGATPLSDTSVNSCGIGNTICAKGAPPFGFCQEVNGVPVNTRDSTATGVGVIVYHNVFSEGSGAHIDTTTISNPNLGTVTSVNLLVWEMSTVGGGAGTETFTVAGQSTLTGGPISCTGSISLAGGATTSSGTCPISLTENSSYPVTISSTGGSGAAWQLAVSLVRLH